VAQLAPRARRLVALMDDRLAALLNDLYARGREHDAGQSDRLDRWRNVEPDTARLMAALVRALSPAHLLELGTSNGYSTIWLADAAQSCGGRLITVEVDRDRASHAVANLGAAGFLDAVELRIADAGQVLASSPDASWEFIFLDAERSAYAAYWPDLVRVLAPRGVLVVDNVVSHASEVAEFRSLVSADERVFEALAPTGAGALLVVRTEP
jgi:predicted O-methyltransferase YrrM